MIADDVREKTPMSMPHLREWKQSEMHIAAVPRLHIARDLS